MEGEGGSGSAGGPAPLARRKAYRGRRTTEMNQIDESLLILPREEEEEAEGEMDDAQRGQREVQEAQARAQEQALNMAKLSRRPEEVLRDLENEAEVLKNLQQKISQQLHMLQVEEIVLKKQAELSHFTHYS